MSSPIYGDTETTETPRDPRRPEVRGDRTKRAILAKAVDLASVDGLEGLTIGRLASELGVSKSGLFAHFGSKLELQLETVQAASELFEEQVWQPVADCRPGVVQLVALMEAWLRYFRDPGQQRRLLLLQRLPRVRRAARAGARRHRGPEAALDGGHVHHIKVAAKRGQLKAGTDPEQLAFELDAVGSLANSLWQLENDEKAFGRAQTAIRTRLHARRHRLGATRAHRRRAQLLSNWRTRSRPS